MEDLQYFPFRVKSRTELSAGQVPKEGTKAPYQQYYWITFPFRQILDSMIGLLSCDLLHIPIRESFPSLTRFQKHKNCEHMATEPHIYKSESKLMTLLPSITYAGGLTTFGKHVGNLLNWQVIIPASIKSNERKRSFENGFWDSKCRGYGCRPASRFYAVA